MDYSGCSECRELCDDRSNPFPDGPTDEHPAASLSDAAVQALWVIDHKATFCAGVPGASEPPKMKFPDLPREAATELRAAKVCLVNDQGRLAVKPEILIEYADELAEHRSAYEQECVAARARAETQFRRLFADA